MKERVHQLDFLKGIFILLIHNEYYEGDTETICQEEVFLWVDLLLS